MDRKFYIQGSTIEGKGVFAALDIQKGEEIMHLKGQRIKRHIKTPEESKRYENWVGIDKDYWLNVCYPYRYLNHSCKPNAAIVEDLVVIAMRDIKKDEEVLFDYSLTDHDEHWSMDCRCGNDNCRGTIRNVEAAPKDVFEWHFPHIPAYFQRAYIKNYIHSQDKKSSPGSDQSVQ